MYTYVVMWYLCSGAVSSVVLMLSLPKSYLEFHKVFLCVSVDVRVSGGRVGAELHDHILYIVNFPVISCRCFLNFLSCESWD